MALGNSDYYYGKAYSEFLGKLRGTKSDTYLSDFDFTKPADYY